MIGLIAAALSGTGTGAAGAMSGNWSNISFSSTTGGSEEVSAVVTFDGGGTRQLLFTHDIRFGTLQVKVGAGTYVSAPTGYTVNVTTGQTVYIKYMCYYVDESATLTIYDNTGAATVDTVTIAFNFTGVPP